jgi:hypothetical protein
MNAALVFQIIEKGLTVIPLLISAGATVMPLVNRLIAVTKGGADGTVTKTELEALEADLDAALDEFNSPLPPKV